MRAGSSVLVAPNIFQADGQVPVAPVIAAPAFGHAVQGEGDAVGIVLPSCGFLGWSSQGQERIMTGILTENGKRLDGWELREIAGRPCQEPAGFRRSASRSRSPCENSMVVVFPDDLFLET